MSEALQRDPWPRTLTEDESRKEKVDPTHDDRLGDHHDHALLHLFHHSVHGARVRQRVRWLLLNAPILVGFFGQVGSRRESVDDVRPPCEEG